MTVLGIDTSCDETAAAIHSEFGGVVPEYASRAHIRTIQPVVEEALAGAGVVYEDLTGIAVTSRPGLVGCLLVGVSFAKALAYSLDIPVVGVDHIEGHVFAVRLAEPDIPLPTICLVVSGGHTELILVEDWGQYRTLGRTRDDASGEAFDKVGKLVGLPYPAGPVIEKLAAGGDPSAIDFPRAMMERGNLDFSFSGVKTAVRYRVDDLEKIPEGDELADFLASFQEAVIDALVTKTMWAAEALEVPSVSLGGGVAANGPLRARFEEEAARLGLVAVVPPKNLCTDNGAVIAAVGDSLLSKGVRDDASLTVSASREAARARR